MFILEKSVGIQLVEVALKCDIGGVVSFQRRYAIVDTWRVLVYAQRRS